MIEKLLALADGRLVIPLIVVVAGVAMVRGAFTLSRSRSQDRRDFLDLFRTHDAQSDLWMTVAIRHVFGAYLPAALIRQLMSGPQPGRALLEVGATWDFFEMNDETGVLTWRRESLRSVETRKILIRVLVGLYVVLGSVSLWLAYSCLTGVFEGRTLWVAWVYVVLGAFSAFGCLSYGDNLKGADKAARRWLGIA